MSTYYGMVLNKTLRDKVEVWLEEEPVKQTSILEELALLRADAQEAVSLYSIATDALENPDLDPDKRAKLEATRADAAALMTTQLVRVTKVAKDAAAIEQGNRGLITPVAVQTMMTQYARCIEKIVSDEQMIAIMELVKNEVQLPWSERVGTDISPGERLDNQVLEMDDTIPEA